VEECLENACTDLVRRDWGLGRLPVTRDNRMSKRSSDPSQWEKNVFLKVNQLRFYNVG
jgi:hypothetical protein